MSNTITNEEKEGNHGRLMAPAIPTRRQTTTFEVGPFTVAVSFVTVITGNDALRVPVEVFFTKRGNKAGESELDSHLYELGTKISKEMQGE